MTTTASSRPDMTRLDPYAFLAVLGKRVIHPGGHRATEELIGFADLAAGQHVLDIGCGVATTAIDLARRHGVQVTAADIARSCSNEPPQTSPTHDSPTGSTSKGPTSSTCL